MVAEYTGDVNVRVSEVGSNSIRVQTAELSSEETQDVRDGLAEAYGVPPEDVASTFIGPTWGADVSQQALQSLVVFIVLVSLVLWIYFQRGQSRLARSGHCFHDLAITVGVHAASGFEVTPATVIGLLTILGYSLYDTVVLCSTRLRRSTKRFAEQTDYTYAEAANLAVNQTLIRSINTSVTGLLPVGSILVIGVLFQGAGTLRDLSLALFVGMLVSAISSIFIASPLAVTLGERQADIKEHTESVLAAREKAAVVNEVKEKKA